MNPRIDHNLFGVPEPHPCILKTSEIPHERLDEDYTELIDCCKDTSVESTVIVNLQKIQ
ncbi:unnamed protein product, partial [Brachionus calyciflorus]